MVFHKPNASPHVSMMSQDSMEREKNAGMPLVADPVEHSRLQREDSVSILREAIDAKQIKNLIGGRRFSNKK